MKSRERHLPLRNVYENLALMIFMLTLLILSLFQEARSQVTDRVTARKPYHSGQRFSTGLDTSFRIDYPLSLRLTSFLSRQNIFVLMYGTRAGTNETSLVETGIAGGFFHNAEVNTWMMKNTYGFHHYLYLTPRCPFESEAGSQKFGLMPLITAAVGMLLSTHGWNLHIETVPEPRFRPDPGTIPESLLSKRQP